MLSESVSMIETVPSEELVMYASGDAATLPAPAKNTTVATTKSRTSVFGMAAPRAARKAALSRGPSAAKWVLLKPAMSQWPRVDVARTGGAPRAKCVSRHLSSLLNGSAAARWRDHGVVREDPLPLR